MVVLLEAIMNLTATNLFLTSRASQTEYLISLLVIGEG